jgi:hypothetical protein
MVSLHFDNYHIYYKVHQYVRVYIEFTVKFLL